MTDDERAFEEDELGLRRLFSELEESENYLDIYMDMSGRTQ